MKKTQLILLFCLISLSCAVPQVATPTPTASISLAPTSTAEIGIVPTLVTVPTEITKIEEADQALFYGDWDRALQLYLSASTYPSVGIQSAAYLGLARAHFAGGDFSEALLNINILITEYPLAPEAAYAYYLQGECFKALDRYAEAAQAYQAYLDLHPGLIDQYVLEQIGDMFFAADKYQDAINAYHEALQFQSANREIWIQMMIGHAYNELGDYETAVVLFEDLLSDFRGDDIHAEILFALGASYWGLAEFDKANAAYLEIVNEYPFTSTAYFTLHLPIDDSIFENALSRGLIYYRAGGSVAVSEFDQYIASEPEHDDTAYYYKGLSLKETGQYAAAIATWQKQIELFSEGQYIAQAYAEIASVESQYLGNYEAAIQTYENFARTLPEHPAVAELLYEAGWVAERSGDPYKATKLWERVGIGYSLSDYAYDAFFQAGITQYRLKEFAKAEVDFQSTVALAIDAEQQAQAYFWVAKAQAGAGDTERAYQFWDQAVGIDPTGYYSQRAAEVMDRTTPFMPAEYDFDFDVQAGKEEVEQWLMVNFLIPSETDFSDLTLLLSHGEFVRGTELWALGQVELARLEFEILRSAIAGDPLKNYLLANHLVEIGLYRIASLATQQLFTLAGYQQSTALLEAPLYLNRIRFGIYFQPLVFPAAESRNFDPLFVSSLIHYESLFEPFIISSTGERGLMQISPAAGEVIYQRTSWPQNYTTVDLDRAFINVDYGIKSLSSQHHSFGGDFYLTLAAYQGSSGDAVAWQEIAREDPDLFLEMLRDLDVREGIKEIYEIYEIYKFVYQIEE